MFTEQERYYIANLWWCLFFKEKTGKCRSGCLCYGVQAKPTWKGLKPINHILFMLCYDRSYDRNHVWYLCYPPRMKKHWRTTRTPKQHAQPNLQIQIWTMKQTPVRTKYSSIIHRWASRQSPDMKEPIETQAAPLRRHSTLRSKSKLKYSYTRITRNCKMLNKSFIAISYCLFYSWFIMLVLICFHTCAVRVTKVYV